MVWFCWDGQSHFLAVMYRMKGKQPSEEQEGKKGPVAEKSLAAGAAERQYFLLERKERNGRGRGTRR